MELRKHFGSFLHILHENSSFSLVFHLFLSRLNSANTCCSVKTKHKMLGKTLKMGILEYLRQKNWGILEFQYNFALK